MTPSIPVLYELSLADQELELSAERIAEAGAAHARLRPGLEELRRLELSFLEPVLEPASALQWLEADR